MTKYNPFKPGSIVHAGMFAGRVDELDLLEKSLFQTENGNPAHFLIHGERGIGKSSLMLLVTGLAEGRIKPLKHDKPFKFITVTVELEPNDDQEDLIRKIAREFQRQLNQSDALKSQLTAAWQFLTSWEVLGVKYKRGALPSDELIDELSDKLERMCKGVGGLWSGVYIFIDEADKPNSGAGLGGFVKVLTERLARRSVLNVGVGVIGISTVINKMKEDHESSVRILTPIHLERLLPNDTKSVVFRGLAEAEKKNGKKTEITPKALELIVQYSEGYPYFIQQYAFCAFEHDTDDVIDDQDVITALIKDNGALQLLGQRYFEGMYTDDIRSNDYRTVLQILAVHMPENCTKKQIMAESKFKPHTVNNAIAALKKRGAVYAVPGNDGLYRLPSESFAAWIKAFKISA